MNRASIAIRDAKRWTAKMRSEDADAEAIDRAERKIADMQAKLEDDIAKSGRDWRDMRKIFDDLSKIKATSQFLQLKIKEMRNATVDEAAAEAAADVQAAGKPLPVGKYEKAPLLRRLMYDLRGSMKTWAMQMFGKENSIGERVLLNIPRQA